MLNRVIPLLAAFQIGLIVAACAIWIDLPPSSDGNIRLSSQVIKQEKVELQWTVSATPAVKIDRYEVFRAVKVLETSNTVCQTTDTILVERDYMYAVRAIGVNGMASPFSDWITIGEGD